MTIEKLKGVLLTILSNFDDEICSKLLIENLKPLCLLSLFYINLNSMTSESFKNILRFWKFRPFLRCTYVEGDENALSLSLYFILYKAAELKVVGKWSVEILREANLGMICFTFANWLNTLSIVWINHLEEKEVPWSFNKYFLYSLQGESIAQKPF